MKRSGHICTLETSDLLERRADGSEVRLCREGTCGDVFKVVNGRREDLTSEEFEAVVVRA